MTDSDDEQLEQLKAWWAQYGKALMAGVTIGALALGGWFGWHEWQTHRQTQAALAFHRVERLADADQSGPAIDAARKVATAYSGTPYAALALLIGARVAMDQHDPDKAALFLKDLIAKTNQPDVVAIATLRLARVQWAQKHPDAAVKTLSAPPAAFAPLYAELRGDILASQKKWPAAYAAYAEALSQPGPDAAFIRMKQDSLPYQPAKNDAQPGAGAKEQTAS